MIFPEKPTCHGEADSRFPSFTRAWRPPDTAEERLCDSCGQRHLEPYVRTFRTCNYCGSIHPEDLLALITEHPEIRLGGSDWKYGWPHKFYVYNIPNPIAGQPAGMMHGPGRIETPEGPRSPVTLSPAPATVQAKLYNTHLLDEGYDDEARGVMIELLARLAHIVFEIREGKLFYYAPRWGYQATAREMNNE